MSETAKKILFEVVRLALRYLGMYLVMKGVFDDGASGVIFSDPAVAESIGGVIIMLTETYFLKAKVEEVKAAP